MEVESLLKDMITLFEKIGNVQNNLEEEIRRTDSATQDLLHELELGNLDGVEMMKVAKQLKEIRQERRKYKDELAKVEKIKAFTDKYNRKFITNDIKLLLKDLKTLKYNNENREYTPRILENLKCAKKIKN